MPPQDMSIYRFLLAGGIAGCCSRTVTAPLEKIKIQAQLGEARVCSSGIFRSLVHTLSREGFVGAWAGNGTNCLRVFPYSGLVCVFYSQSIRMLPSDSELDAMEPVYRMIAGGFAGSAATVITYPLDVIRARLTVTKAIQQNGFLKTAREIIAESGPRGFYAGLSTTLAAVAPFVGIQQASYDVMKMLAIDRGFATPSVSFFTLCGVASGVIAQSVVYPLDLLRRRIQIGGIESTWARMYTWQALRKVARDSGGARGLYAGIGPSYAKVAPAVASSLVVRDAVLGRLSDKTFDRSERL